MHSSALVLLNGKIILCGGASADTNKCWKYNIRYNEWTELTTSTFYHQTQPAQVYNEKLYYLNVNNQSEIYDPITNIWHHWAPPPVSHGDHSCMVTWRDTFIVLGGFGHPRGVDLYNITSNTWKSLNTMPPIPRAGHACSPMPNNPDKFMIVGGKSDKHHVAIYDARTDYWSTAAKTNTARFYARLVLLGKRIFVIGGGNDAENYDTDTVEEYLLDKDVWETKNIRISNRRSVFASLAVPASFFNDENLYSPFEDGCRGV